MALRLIRGVGQRILIGDTIVVSVVRISRDGVCLEILAPRDVPVDREELRTKKDKTRELNEQKRNRTNE